MQGWALLGLAQLEAGDPAAETSLRRALALDPDNRNVSRNLGVLFYRQQRLTEAVHQFQRLAELDPDDSEVLVALAAMLDDAGRYPEAISVLRKAGVLQPTSGEIKADLGIALVHLGELPAAKSALFDALERLSAEHQRTTELASLLVRKGQGASVLALMAERGQATPRLTPYLAAIRAALSAVSPEG